MNKPFLSIVFIWLVIAGLIAFSAHSCSAPKPVIQDAPAERVKPIAERITEPEAPTVAKPVHRFPVESPNPRIYRHHARAETCRPETYPCGAWLRVNGEWEKM